MEKSRTLGLRHPGLWRRSNEWSVLGFWLRAQVLPLNPEIVQGLLGPELEYFMIA